MNDLRESMRRAAGAVEPVPDLEDVFRRARWRPPAARYVVVCLVVAAIAAGVAVPALVASRRSLSPTDGGHGTGPAVSSTVAAAGDRLRLVGTFPQSGSLFTAGGGAFFSVAPPQSCGGSATVFTVTNAGSLTQGALADPLACYFNAMAADAGSVYAGTEVIAKFSSASNEVVRLDPVDLAVLARRDVPGGVVGLVVGPNGLLVATSDEVLLLDPTSLATRASYVIPGAVPPPVGLAQISSLALGRGGVWVTYGTAQTTTLYRLDPSTLALRTTAQAGSGQGLRVVADDSATWLVGPNTVRQVGASGSLYPPLPISDLQGAAAEGDGLVVLEGGAADESLVLLDGSGDTLAKAPADDAGSQLALDGTSIWVLHGILALRQGALVDEEGIAHFVIGGSPR